MFCFGQVSRTVVVLCWWLRCVSCWLCQGMRLTHQSKPQHRVSVLPTTRTERNDPEPRVSAHCLLGPRTGGCARVHSGDVGCKKKTGNASPNEWDPNGKMMPLQKQKRTKIVACARELYKTSPTTPGSSDLRVSCALPSGPTLLRPASRRSPSRCAGDSFGVFHGRFETVPSTLCDRPGGGNAINFLSVEHRKWVTGRISWGDFRNSTHFWVVIWLDCYNAHSIQF